MATTESHELSTSILVVIASIESIVHRITTINRNAQTTSIVVHQLLTFFNILLAVNQDLFSEPVPLFMTISIVRHDYIGAVREDSRA